MNELAIGSTQINETKSRIKSKLLSLNYQTLPSDLGFWYVVITELRLLFLSPLVVIRKDNKDIHNITEDEFIDYVKPVFLPDTINDENDTPKNFYPFPEKEGDFTFLPPPLPQKNSMDVHLPAYRLDLQKNHNKLLVIKYKNTKYEIQSWREVVAAGTNAPWENSNLDKINGVIVCLPDSNSSFWVFLDTNIDTELHSDLASLFEMINEFYKSIENPSDLEKMIRLGKYEDLYAISKYKEYYLEESEVFPELPLEAFDLREDYIKTIFSQKAKRKIMQNKFEDYFKNHTNKLKYKLSIFLHREITVPEESELKEEISELINSCLERNLQAEEIVIRLRKHLSKKIPSRRENFGSFLDGFKTTSYLKVIDDFFDRIYRRFVSILKSKFNDYLCGINFIALDSDFYHTFIYTFAHYQILAEREKSIKIRSNTQSEEDLWRKIWSHKSEFLKSGGLSTYIEKSKYPEFISQLKVGNSESSDLRINGKYKPTWDIFYALPMEDPTIIVAQIPCVFAEIDIETVKDEMENLRKNKKDT
ncbi:MAG: hypothetical protein Q8P40_05700 [Nitrospirota bacterium]|nr:hypothetical protein [Nitrospirota bacterium]